MRRFARRRRRPETAEAVDSGGAAQAAGIATPQPAVRRSNKVPHVTRPDLCGAAHVVLRIRRGLPTLRSPKVYRVLERSFRASCERNGFRLIDFSIQHDHVHLIVEAQHKTQLARELQSLMIRIAKRLNAFWQKRKLHVGRVVADRYFALALTSRSHIWRTVRYVLDNGRKHGSWTRDDQPDRYSSGKWYRNWSERDQVRRPTRRAPVAVSHLAVLLFIYPISLKDVPGARHYDDSGSIDVLHD